MFWEVQSPPRTQIKTFCSRLTSHCQRWQLINLTVESEVNQLRILAFWGKKKTKKLFPRWDDSFSRADKTRFSKRLKVKFNKLISAHARKYEPQSAAVAVKIFFMQHQRPFLIDWPSFAVAGESLAVMFGPFGRYVCFHAESYRYNMQYSATKCLETT